MHSDARGYRRVIVETPVLSFWNTPRYRIEAVVFSDLEKMVNAACHEINGNNVNWYNTWIARVYSIVLDKSGNITEYVRWLKIVRGCSSISRYLLHVKRKPTLACVRIEYRTDGSAQSKILYIVWHSSIFPREYVSKVVKMIEWEIQKYFAAKSQ